MTDVGQHAKHNSGQQGLHQEGGVWCVDAKTFVDVTFIDTSSHSRKVVTREGQACPEQGCAHWLHDPLVHGDNALHVDVVELVDLKNFTAVFQDGVQAVGRLRLVCVRNHAEGEPAHVARA